MLQTQQPAKATTESSKTDKSFEQVAQQVAEQTKPQQTTTKQPEQTKPAQKPEQESQQVPQEAAMEMMAFLLQTQPAEQTMVVQPAQVQPAQAVQSVQNAQVMATAVVPQQLGAEQVQASAKQPMQTTVMQQSQPQPQTVEVEQSGQQNAGLQTVQLSTSQQDTQTEQFELGRSFREAVAMVKQNQNTQKDTDNTEMPDIDALQAQVNDRRIDIQGQMKMQQVSTSQVEQPDVSKQIVEKTLTFLQNGEREFTMTLTPESLGEVTVRVLQKEGKITLSIAAANESTVKLLNGQLEALKMAVRPMQVEVEPAVVQTQQSNGENMSQQMDMSNGQFFNQSHQTQQQMQQNQNTATGWGFDETEDTLASLEQAQQAAQILADNMLDLYV